MINNLVSPSSIVAGAIAHAGLFDMRPINHFPAPRRIKSYVSFYDTSKHGTLRHFNYRAVKGEPRPAWTYRANRRNMAHKRIPLTSLANVVDVDSQKQ